MAWTQLAYIGMAVVLVCVTGARPYDRYGRAGSQPGSCPGCEQ